jgi:hypothetical protein
MWSSRGNENWKGKPKYSEKTCPNATLSTTNTTWSDLGSKPGRRGGKPATNCLSYGTTSVKGLGGSGCSDWGILVLSLIPLPPHATAGRVHKLGHDHSQFHVLCNSLSVNHLRFRGCTVRPTEVVIKYMTNDCKINLEEVKFTISHIAFVSMLASLDTNSQLRSLLHGNKCCSYVF